MGEIYYERILLALMLPMNSTTPWNSVETLEKIGQNRIWRNLIKKNLSFEKKKTSLLCQWMLQCQWWNCQKFSFFARHSKHLWCVTHCNGVSSFINEYSNIAIVCTVYCFFMRCCNAVRYWPKWQRNMFDTTCGHRC